MEIMGRGHWRAMRFGWLEGMLIFTFWEVYNLMLLFRLTPGYTSKKEQEMNDQLT